ncbi:FMN-binding protein [Aestuariivirga litoralis]|uniref:FMN-binding protein n=1 Tax=Aestuariivirga litoralis TaxID=2650924 RepID=UPI0018C7ECEA|nr:FMN-binding protein [Aestuariivirga litoralis]MBG1230798.1 FMN-binding protein [Aestuariivirga litoralis]
MKLVKQIAVLAGSIAALFGSQSKAAQLAVKDGTFDGAAYDAYYGPVQVELVINGGRIVNATALQSPDHRRTSVAINKQALPYLRQEVIQAQSGRVNAVSGATLTSRAYASSVADALRQASQ